MNGIKNVGGHVYVWVCSQRWRWMILQEQWKVVIQRWQTHRMLWLALAVAGCVGLAHWYWTAHRYDGLLQFVVLDVGQGTGIYIKTPSSKEILYDTGPTTQSLRQLERYRHFFDRSIDVVIGSHADADHVGMVPRIMDSYEVNTLVLGPGERESALFTKIHAYEVTTWHQGDKVVLDTDLYLEVLHPAREEKKSGNNESLVVILNHLDNKFLLTGDIDRNTELRLVEQYGHRLNSDVLLVSHHGSRSSSGEKFIQTVLPRLAVISAGKDNRYGHPHNDVLDTLRRYEIPVVRTDQMGNVHILSDGRNLLVQ